MQIGLLKAIRFFGSQKALAKALGVRQQAISHWLNRQNNIPYVHVINMVCLTKGYVTFEELAPGHKLNDSILHLLNTYPQYTPLPNDNSVEINEFKDKVGGELSRKSVNQISLVEQFQKKNIYCQAIEKLHMGDHAKISTRYWIDIVTKKMKQLGADPIITSFYLLTCPHANKIGVYPLALSYAAYDTGLSQERVKNALDYLQQINYCSYDEENEYIWVHEMAIYQISGPLRAHDEEVRLVNALYHSLPELSFLDKFYHFYRDRFFLMIRKSGDLSDRQTT